MRIKDIAGGLQRQQSGLPNRGQAKPVVYTEAMLLYLTVLVVEQTRFCPSAFMSAAGIHIYRNLRHQSA